MNKTRRIINKLLDDITDFFPYFFGFYIFSLLMSLIFHSWELFFDWDMFTLSVVTLGAASLFSSKARSLFDFILLKWRERVLIRGIISRVKDVNLSSIRNNLLSVIRWVRKIYQEIYKRIVFITKFFVDIIIEIWKRLSRRGQIKIVIILSILSFALVKSMRVIDFIILAYALASILFIFKSRISAVLAMILLVGCLFFLMFKKGNIAEVLASYAYYFLVITIVTQIVEHKRDDMP